MSSFEYMFSTSEYLPDAPEINLRKSMQQTGEARTVLTDRFQRTIDYTRISVTSDCNLRCFYCKRESPGIPTPDDQQMKTGEIKTLIELLAEMGIRKIRFTGGEPLLRPDIVDLVQIAKSTTGIETVSLTTNGTLLEKHFEALVSAGLDGINLSIDTLNKQRFFAITRRDKFIAVHKMLKSLLNSSLLTIKLNVLLLRGINSDEIKEFVALTMSYPVTIRFMELQPFDDRQIWRTGRFMSAEKIRAELFAAYPALSEVSGSATEFFSYRLPGSSGSLAIIPAYTRNFCSKCKRLRITSDGKVLSCLYHTQSLDLLPDLRNRSAKHQLEAIIRKAVSLKPENGKHGNNAKGMSMSEIGG